MTTTTAAPGSRGKLRPLAWVVASACLGFAATAPALDLPDQPLLSTSSVQPNVMLFIDNSGSMSTFELGYYDSNTVYATCPTSLQIQPAQQDIERDTQNGKYQKIVAKKDANGVAYFSYERVIRGTGGLPDRTETTDYQWGTSATGTEPYTVACFSNGNVTVGTKTQAAQYDMRPDTASNNYYTFSGNAMNYYFANAALDGPDTWTGTRKEGSGTRLQLSQSAGTALVNTITDKRIGLSTFEKVSWGNEKDSNGGAEILVGINDIDAVVAAGTTQRDKIIQQLNTISASGATPIGETLSDITRYFVTGYEDKELRIHPNDASRATNVKASELFSGVPIYAAGVAVPGTGNNAVIQESCQKNFVVALTDGEPNETGTVSDYLRGDTLNYDASGKAYYEGYDSSQPNYRETTTVNGNTVTRDLGSLNDVTLAMFEVDLRPDLGDDEINNIKTFFVGGFESSLQNNDVLTQAAKNGAGDSNQTVYPAYNQTQLEEAFEAIFVKVDTDSGSRTSVAFNAGSIGSGTTLFQATYQFLGSQWNGDIRAYGLAESGSDLFSGVATWSANELLTDRVKNATPGADSRQIITLSGFHDQDGISVRDGIAFTTANQSEFSTEMTNDLDGDGSDPTLLPKVVNYLRGAEYNIFRKRIDADYGILGDIVHSSPVEIGIPEINYPDYDANADHQFGDENNDYSAFVTSYSNRDSVVYVGANDGMLHAFDGDPTAAGGEELFAYLPSMLADGSTELDGLYYLTNKRYQHRFYVDGTITASDLFIDPTGGTSPSWNTILFGTLGLGGKGLFALDITDPSSFSEANADDIVLWEFGGESSTPTTGDPDMGHIFGEPKVSMMNDGRFAVIVGNGANSTNGVATLFIIFVEQGADGSWESDDWIELSTGAGSDNGLSTPVLADLNNDRVVDRIYAGDLKGNLWAFDVSSTVASDWSAAYGTAPLFTATDDNGNAQPITSAPLVVSNEDTRYAGNEPNVIVLFGTGKFVEMSDIGDTAQQSFYAVWDRGEDSLQRDDLHQRALVNKNDVNGNLAGRTMDENSPYSDPVAWYDGNNADEYGWYMDLPAAGERVTIEPTILLGTIFFLSSVPEETPCNTGGYGFLNSITVQGLSTQTPIFDFDGDGDIDFEDEGYVSQITSGDKGLPAGSAFIGAGDAEQPCPGNNGQYQAYSTIDGEIHYRWVCPESATGMGRMAWQELFGE